FGDLLNKYTRRRREVKGALRLATTRPNGTLGGRMMDKTALIREITRRTRARWGNAMATGQLGRVVRHLRKAALLPGGADLADGELLESFLARRDEAAFTALVQRHGPMVLGVCRRVLKNQADAEDAFQATFLVLVRKATSVVPRAWVGNWLYGVAHNTALKAR